MPTQYETGMVKLERKQFYVEIYLCMEIRVHIIFQNLNNKYSEMILG